jgi:hypothetical protein
LHSVIIAVGFQFCVVALLILDEIDNSQIHLTFFFAVNCVHTSHESRWSFPVIAYERPARAADCTDGAANRLYLIRARLTSYSCMSSIMHNTST